MTSTENDADIAAPATADAADVTDPARGPAVVALGGGHGLAATLRAARSYAGSITGIVSVGDDGGSSGRLRAEFGVAPPGDVRRCISALATSDTLLARSLEYRFEQGVLTGHPVGNLLLAGLTMMSGDFQEAIDELCRTVGAVGSIFPATTVPVQLLADSDQGTLVGQVTIERASGIRNLRFHPNDPPVAECAGRAVREADQVVIGPGSLFTSVLAAAVVPGIRAALQESSGQRVFVANVANEKGMARGFGLAEHIDALADHGVKIDVVVADASSPPATGVGPAVIRADVAAGDGWGHDPAKLGRVLHQVHLERG